MGTYDPIAGFYDLEYEDFTDDLPLYLELASRTGSPVLDIGCGSGRVTFALAGAGFQVTGIDESEAMLARARSRIGMNKKFAHRVDLLQIPAASYASTTKHNIAIMAVNTFGHFLTKRAQLEVLRQIRQQLSAGGILVIDMTPPDPSSLNHQEGPLLLQWTKQDTETGTTVQKWVTYYMDHTRQIQHHTLIYDAIQPNGTVYRTTIPMPLRYSFRYEAELLLDMTGFSTEQVYGSYQLEEYNAASERMIFVATVTESRPR